MAQKNTRQTRAKTARGQLEQAILSNTLPAGYQAMEPELALQYGVSRTTIREALIRLEAEGLVEMIPRRGARVVPISTEDMREIYHLLISLESDAVFALAQTGLSDADRDMMTGLVDDMALALETKDLSAWASADDGFHRGILDLRGSRRLGRIVSALLDQAHRARLVARGLRPLPVQSLEDHRNILDAILRQNAQEARALYCQHRERGAREIIEVLEKLPKL